MRVSEIMSSPVVVTTRNIKLSNLKDQLIRKSINAVPVLEENGEIAGIITTNDIIAVHNESLTVNDILTPKVHICIKNNRVKDAAKTMVKHGIHHLVVMEDGKVIGMLSSLDILEAYSNE